MRRARALLVAGLLVALVGGVPAHAGAQAGASSSGWTWPLPGEPEVDRPFQPPTSAWGAGHRGVDLRGELGLPVRAAGPGTITYSGLLAGRGVVTVSHAGGLRTTYEPVDATVGVGDVVAAGDVIGTLATGHASCRIGVTCLHWGLLRGKTYLDALGLVVAGKLQLLPFDAKGPKKDKRKKQRSKEKEKSRKSKLSRLRSKVTKAAKKTARSALKAAKSAGRVVKRVVMKNASRIVQAAARQAARSAAASAAVAVSPEVLLAVGVVVVVGGVVYFVRK
jgi:hypothetical protein